MARFANQGLDHVAIGVADVERSARLYRDVVGLERAHEASEVSVVMDPDGHQLELITYEV